MYIAQSYSTSGRKKPVIPHIYWAPLLSGTILGSLYKWSNLILPKNPVLTSSPFYLYRNREVNLPKCTKKWQSWKRTPRQPSSRSGAPQTSLPGLHHQASWLDLSPGSERPWLWGRSLGPTGPVTIVTWASARCSWGWNLLLPGTAHKACEAPHGAVCHVGIPCGEVRRGSTPLSFSLRKSVKICCWVGLSWTWHRPLNACTMDTKIPHFS